MQTAAESKLVGDGHYCYANRMPRAFGKGLCLMAVFVLAGGHWGVLQSVAWVGMLSSYARDYGVMQAVSMTFDGKNPCHLCKKVEEGQQRQQDGPALLKQEKKTEAVSAVVALVVAEPAGSAIFWPKWSAAFMTAELADVETPPPRV